MRYDEKGITPVTTKEFVKLTLQDKEYSRWFSNINIDDVADYVFDWNKDNQDSNVSLFDLHTSVPRKDRLKKVVSRELNNGKIPVSILNKDGKHWVTLVVAINGDNKYDIYYADSFGGKIEDHVVSVGLTLGITKSIGEREKNWYH